MSKKIETAIDIYKKSNCKLCNSKLRSKAEDMYESGKSIHQVYKFLIQEGEDISYPSVKNHLENHYIKQKTEILVQEYKKDVEKYVNESKNRVKSLYGRKALFEKSLIELAAKNDLIQDIEQQRKIANSLKSLNDSIVSIEAQIDAINNRIEPVIVIIEKLREIVQKKMEEKISDESKELLLDVIGQLEEEAQNLYIEEHTTKQ